MTSRLLIAGNDKIGRRLIARVRGFDDLAVAVDASTDWRRVARLVISGRLRIAWLAKIAWAEWRRPAAPALDVPAVRTNADVLAFIERGVRQVFLFRAGLIVNGAVLASGADVLNLHCAALPRYGGLGALARALGDRAYAQTATLHRVTRTIDGGPVLATRPFDLDPGRSYAENEDRAYDTGMQLLEGVLAGRVPLADGT